jgi:hypothetical protein
MPDFRIPETARQPQTSWFPKFAASLLAGIAVFNIAMMSADRFLLSYSVRGLPQCHFVYARADLPALRSACGPHPAILSFRRPAARHRSRYPEMGRPASRHRRGIYAHFLRREEVPSFADRRKVDRRSADPQPRYCDSGCLVGQLRRVANRLLRTIQPGSSLS